MNYSSKPSELSDVKREIFMCLLEGKDERAMQLLAYYEYLWKQANPPKPEAGAGDLTSALRRADADRHALIEQKVNDHIHNREYDRARILATTLERK